ncbi:hypothetical protein B0H67DRAFT_571923 [Lasiosphaeris hirsuta]|uniref:Uncharacterized protein n=1 Tax=Lasiosphaeris hirsuta TaxID=260670 RepID=A0AA40B1H0_9PEZI|nr:hypothetical protein B0H67DRAFT_571923 [Lasiosphaeris hirsuta]
MWPTSFCHFLLEEVLVFGKVWSSPSVFSHLPALILNSTLDPLSGPDFFPGDSQVAKTQDAAQREDRPRATTPRRPPSATQAPSQPGPPPGSMRYHLMAPP